MSSHKIATAKHIKVDSRFVHTAAGTIFHEARTLQFDAQGRLERVTAWQRTGSTQAPELGAVIYRETTP